MSDEKGKDRAPEAKGKGKSRDDEGSSLASRVLTSATELTKSAFAAPGSHEIRDAAAAASAASNKGYIPSGTGSSAWAESSKPAQQNGPSYTNQLGGASGSFRPGDSEQHSKNAEMEFASFLDGTDTFQPSEPGQNPLLTGEEFGHNLTQIRGQVPVTSVSSPITVAEQQNLDGSEVVAILSGSNGAREDFEAPEEEQESYDWGLSEEQLAQIRTITKDLFPSWEPHGAVSVDNPLNLNPLFTDQTSFPQTDTPADESYMHFGIRDPLTARQMWREQWEGVLTRYTDEVWGGLLPLVKEARKEVEDMRNSEGSETQEPKALRRLGMILGHLRKQ